MWFHRAQKSLDFQGPTSFHLLLLWFCTHQTHYLRGHINHRCINSYYWLYPILFLQGNEGEPGANPVPAGGGSGRPRAPAPGGGGRHQARQGTGGQAHDRLCCRRRAGQPQVSLPDPFRGTNSILPLSSKIIKKNLDFNCFVTFLWLFIVEKWLNVPSKSTGTVINK